MGGGGHLWVFVGGCLSTIQLCVCCSYSVHRTPQISDFPPGCTFFWDALPLKADDSVTTEDAVWVQPLRIRYDDLEAELLSCFE